MKIGITGIIVGRFQVPALTRGHIGLINEVLGLSSEVIVFIGDTKDGRIDSHDPLPYQSRRKMIQNAFPDKPLKIFRLEDIGNFPLWVKELDNTIDLFIKTEIIRYSGEIILFGSRDSFISGYKANSGKYKTREIKEIGNGVSGTKSRYDCYKSGIVDSLDFRKGIIWALYENDKYQEKLNSEELDGTRD